MQRLELAHPGDPTDALALTVFDPPTPGPEEVLIEMEAATVNPSDFSYISGRYFVAAEPGAHVGAEGVGRVVAVGSDVDDALSGRRALLLPTYRHGTWATHVVAAAADVIPVPDSIDAEQLAMLGINPMTALRLIRDYGNPHAAERWIGQTAGNSAVGQYLIKLARQFGHRTVSIVRRDDAAREVLASGGDQVVVDGSNLASDLTRVLDGSRLDLAVDCVGGPASTQLAHHLRFEGTLVSYGVLSGQPPAVAVPDLVGNHINLTGFWMVNWVRQAPRDQVRDAYLELVDLIANGTLSARVQARFDLTDWRDAVALARTDGRDGKVLLTFGGVEDRIVGDGARRDAPDVGRSA
jgi:NADPH:quinone reductase-like Zn-dependent oxidoreductase